VVTPGSEVRVTYALSPTAATPFGVGLTNTVEVAGSVLGPFTRRETVVQAHLVWLPVVVRENLGWRSARSAGASQRVFPR
jgi:hypothetical protein